MRTPDLPHGPRGKTSKTRAIPSVPRFSHLQLPGPGCAEELGPRGAAPPASTQAPAALRDTSNCLHFSLSLTGAVVVPQKL